MPIYRHEERWTEFEGEEERRPPRDASGQPCRGRRCRGAEAEGGGGRLPSLGQQEGQGKSNIFSPLDRFIFIFSRRRRISLMADSTSPFAITLYFPYYSFASLLPSHSPSLACLMFLIKLPLPIPLAKCPSLLLGRPSPIRVPPSPPRVPR